MKKATFIVLGLILSIRIIAQEIPLDIVTRVNAVDYIFEGKVINSQSYFANGGGGVYSHLKYRRN
jgi:hypothetical protein